MGLSQKQLGKDEVVIMHLRTHWKKLIRPIAVLCALAGLTGAAVALMPVQLKPWGWYVLAVVVFTAALIWALIPLLQWSCTTFTLTNKRIVTRRGILNRVGHDLPLKRISDVTYERSVLDRILGCGTMVVQTAAEDPLSLTDIPQIEKLHLQMNELLFDQDPHQLANDGT